MKVRLHLHDKIMTDGPLENKNLENPRGNQALLGWEVQRSDSSVLAEQVLEPHIRLLRDD